MMKYKDVIDKMYTDIDNKIRRNKRPNTGERFLQIIYDIKNMSYIIRYSELDLLKDVRRSCDITVPEIRFQSDIPGIVDKVVENIEMQMSIFEADYAWMNSNPNDFIFYHDEEDEYGAYIPSV